MSGTIGGPTGGEPTPQPRGVAPARAANDPRIVDQAITAYSASRDARSGEREVTRMPSIRGLFRQIRRDGDGQGDGHGDGQDQG
jgi:hypothetical protein